jgi:hypothetical protein
LNLSKTKLKLSHLDSTASRRLGAPTRRVWVSVAPAATPPDTNCTATIKSNPIEAEQGRQKEHDSEEVVLLISWEVASVYGGRWKKIEFWWSFDFDARAVVEAACVAQGARTPDEGSWAKGWDVPINRNEWSKQIRWRGWTVAQRIDINVWYWVIEDSIQSTKVVELDIYNHVISWYDN